MAETEDLKSFQYRFESDRGHYLSQESDSNRQLAKQKAQPDIGLRGENDIQAIQSK